jgi:predicted MFS family arabinose efflux permease
MTSRADGLTTPVMAAIYLGVAAATLPAVMPLMVAVLGDDLGFGTEQAGYIASANMGGLLLGVVTCAILATRVSWGALLLAGLAIMICTNLLTMLGSAFIYIASMRFFSGLGEGIVGSICYAAMGRSRQPTRAIAFYLAGQGLVGAVGMAAIPIIVQRAGWQWLFVAVSILAVPGFGLSRRIGTLRETPYERASESGLTLSWAAWYALVGILIYFTGMAAIWAFLERIGEAKGVSLAHLSFALSASAIGGMAGSLTVGFVAHRLSTLAGLTSGLCLLLVGIVGLALWDAWQVYLVATIFFYFAWSFQYAFQFKVLAAVDRGAKIVGIVPAVTFGGLTIGPAIGGVLLSLGGSVALCVFGLTCVLASVAGAVHLQFRLTTSNPV